MDSLSARVGFMWMGHRRGRAHKGNPGAQRPGWAGLGDRLGSGSLERARVNLESFGDRLLLQEGNYGDLPEILTGQGLGLWTASSWISGLLRTAHIERGRFLHPNFRTLDMRFSPRTRTNAGEVLTIDPRGNSGRFFRVKGEERWAGRIARAIVRSRPLSSTDELAAWWRGRCLDGEDGFIPPRGFPGAPDGGEPGTGKHSARDPAGGGMSDPEGSALRDHVPFPRGSVGEGVVPGERHPRRRGTVSSADPEARTTERRGDPDQPSARSAKLRILERMQEGI